MSDPPTADIPTVDLSPALEGSPTGILRVARQLDEVYTDVGFGFVVGHGIDRSLVDDLFEASKRFHALPIDEKEAIAVNDAHRGFIGLATSTIVTSSVDEVRRPNQSESFMVMHEVGDDHPEVVAGTPLAGPNQWPASAPEIREPIERYVAAMADLGREITRMVAVALGAPVHQFDADFADPVTFLRLLRYPPRPPDSPDDLYGAAPHTDYGFITLLAQHAPPSPSPFPSPPPLPPSPEPPVLASDKPREAAPASQERGVGVEGGMPVGSGLQVRSTGGSWIDVPVVEDAFVLNSADILRRWSNGRWVSTPHRVINRTGQERYSAPFFFDPHMGTEVAPLPSCIPRGQKPKFEPVVYGDYLMERLQANYSQHQG